MRKQLPVLAAVVSLALPLAAAPPARATFPGARGVVAFGRTTPASTDVWVKDLVAGTTTRLTTTTRGREIMPDYNADGSRIAFSKCGRGEFSNCDIWTMAQDGSDLVRLTKTTQPDDFTPMIQEVWPTWSPDGTRIAYTSNEASSFQDIYVMNSDGSDPTRLTVNDVFDAFPEWSPDGTKIVFTSDRANFDDIWLMDGDGSDPIRLTRGDAIDERPDWSPDSSQIVFTRNSKVTVMDADGSDITKLTTTGHATAPTFSPDGKKIVYGYENGDTARVPLWVMNADGSHKRRLTSGRFDFAPDWQPNPI